MAKSKKEIDDEIMKKRSMIESLRNQMFTMSSKVSEKEVDKCFKKIEKLNKELDSLRKESRKILNAQSKTEIVKDANMSLNCSVALKGF